MQLCLPFLLPGDNFASLLPPRASIIPTQRVTFINSFPEMSTRVIPEISPEMSIIEKSSSRIRESRSPSLYTQVHHGSHVTVGTWHGCTSPGCQMCHLCPVTALELGYLCSRTLFWLLWLFPYGFHWDFGLFLLFVTPKVTARLNPP